MNIIPTLTASFAIIIKRIDLMVMLFAASNICIEIDGMKAFIFKELAVDTEYNFNCSPNVVQGGYIL